MAYDLPLSFILSFCREMIPGRGEDSECHSFSDNAGLIGVFDGCGGSGARTHDWYSGKTEAFMASRLLSGSFYDCFRRWGVRYHSGERFARKVLWPVALKQLNKYRAPEDPDGIRIGGSMIRSLPSTAAAAILLAQPDGTVEITAAWAGDSRVYLLDSNGLAQLTVDNATVEDPMENIYEDGILTNVFCTDREVVCHTVTVRCKPPFLVFAATDGCYGYLSTPMEFELVLLGNLMNASCAAQWEENIAQDLASVSGDDHTMSMAAVGYDSFEQLKSSLLPRYQRVWKEFVEPIRDLPMEHREPRFQLWEQYRPNYFRFLKDGKN